MDNLKLTGNGSVDIGYIFTGSLPDQMPLTSSLTLPRLTYNTDIMMHVHTELYNTYQPMKDEFEAKNNIVLLFSNTQSLPCGASNVPIRSVEELKGKKLRTVGRVTELIKILGGAPVGMQSSEIYEAAKRKVIDGVAAIPFSDLGKTYGGLYETMPYIFDYGLRNYSGGTSMAMNLDLFKGFPEDIRKIIGDLRDEEPDFASRINQESNKVALKEYEAAKLDLYVWPNEEMEKVRKASSDLWNNVIADIEKKQPNVPIREFMEKVHALVKKYEEKINFIHPFNK